MSFEDLYRSLKTDFISKARAVIVELEAWNEDELFYRRWHELRHNKKALEALVDNLDPQIISKRKIVTPEFLEQNRNGFHFSEDRFFSSQKTMHWNVRFVKHNRYCPGGLHKHEYFEVVFVLHGQCTNIIADRQMVLSAGSLCFITPETYHAIEVFDSSIVINIIIRRRTFDEVFANLLTTSDILSRFFLKNIYSRNPEYLVFNIANDADILEQLLAMLVEQSVSSEESGRIMENQLLIFFSLLKRKYGKSPLVYEQIGVKEQHWKIIAYINEHFRVLTQAKLAEKFNLSIAYCSRVIKSITGKNFTTLIHDLRMNHARTMLIKSDAKIYDISFSLGYENQETFIRNFKKVHGITPVQYRKNNSGIEHKKRAEPAPRLFAASHH